MPGVTASGATNARAPTSATTLARTRASDEACADEEGVLQGKDNCSGSPQARAKHRESLPRSCRATCGLSSPVLTSLWIAFPSTLVRTAQRSRFLAGEATGAAAAAIGSLIDPTGIDALLFPLGVLDMTVVASVGEVEGVDGEEEYGEYPGDEAFAYSSERPM